MKILTKKIKLFPSLIYALLIYILIFNEDIINLIISHQLNSDKFTFNVENIESKLLSKYHSKTVTIKAAVLIPPDQKPTKEPIITMYHFLGFGGKISDSLKAIKNIKQLTIANPELGMIHIFLKPEFDGFYHYFTDSYFNGPFESALTDEAIPYIENKLGLSNKQVKRFLTGHSSGGWTAAWLQTDKSDLFDGTWAVSPDPLDFQNFYGIDIRNGSSDNFYRTNDGIDRPASRTHHSEYSSLKEYVYYDAKNKFNDFLSYERAFVPFNLINHKFLETTLFDRESGVLNQNTLTFWEQFNVAKKVSGFTENYKHNLNGKLNIFCGEKDDYFLDKPAHSFCDILKENKIDHQCIFLPWAGHVNIYNKSAEYPNGLMYYILKSATSNSN